MLARQSCHLKIVHKNLQQMINQSSLASSKTHQSIQKRAKTCSNHQNEVDDPYKKSVRKLNHNTQRSCSKHSLKSTPKINTKLKTQSLQFNKCDTSSIERQHNLYFNKIDVAFTDLEDHFCQLKEKVISNLQNIMQNNKGQLNLQSANHYIESITTMTENIKKFTEKVRDHREIKPNHCIQKNYLSDITKQLNKEDELNNLSLKNRKSRQYERGSAVIKNKKQSVYQMILLENKMKFQSSKRK